RLRLRRPGLAAPHRARARRRRPRRTRPGSVTVRVVHVDAEVLAHKRSGGHHLVTLVAPGVAELHRPGTFAELTLGGPHSDRLTRHAFWILRANPSGTYGGTVELLVS